MLAREWHRAKYDIDPETGCWLWNRGLDKDGYGYVHYKGGKRRTSRVFYEEEFGPIPEGLQLDHFVCDTKRCVNPWHVKPVTLVENSRRRKSNNITMEIARAIRMDYVNGVTRYDIEHKYKISAPDASRIIHNSRWKE